MWSPLILNYMYYVLIWKPHTWEPLLILSLPHGLMWPPLTPPVIRIPIMTPKPPDKAPEINIKLNLFLSILFFRFIYFIIDQRNVGVLCKSYMLFKISSIFFFQNIFFIIKLWNPDYDIIRLITSKGSQREVEMSLLKKRVPPPPPPPPPLPVSAKNGFFFGGGGWLP